MGFLSRKSKFKEPVEEQHPIVEELEEMEAAVPETPETDSPQPAGPVGAGNPPPPAVA